MKAANLLILVVSALLILDTVAGEIKPVIVEPEEGQEIIADLYGDTLLSVDVRNDGDEKAYNCSLDISGPGINFTILDTNLTINSGSTESFDPHILGTVENKINVEITAFCFDSDGDDFESEEVTIILREPKPDIKIISPTGTKTYVSLPADNSVRFTVFVENRGDVNVPNVRVTLENRSGTFTCTTSGPQTIQKGRNANYDAVCRGVESGDRIAIIASDSTGGVKDYEAIIVVLPPEVVAPSLRILQPNSGSSLSFSEANSMITVRVKNEGNADAEDVCISLSNLDYMVVGVECKDIVAGAIYDFIVIIQSIPDTPVSSTVKVEESSGQTQSQILVTIRRTQETSPPPTSPPPELQNISNMTNQTANETATDVDLDLRDTLESIRLDVYKNNVLIVSTQLVVVVLLIYNLLILRRETK